MQKEQEGWSRRQFIANVSGMGALIAVNPGSPHRLSWAVDDPDPRVAAIVSKTIGVDTHNHIDVPLNAAEQPGPTVDLAGVLQKSGLLAICMTFAVDYQRLVNPGDGYERFMKGMDAMDKLLESNKLKRTMNLAELRTAHKSHKPTVIQSVEGGHFLEGKLERLDEAYKRGLRQLGLLHDNDASVPLGDVYTNNPQFSGLTTFGAEVIKKCNQLGILVDLTHASNDTMNAALKIATKPVIVSHTGLDTQLGKNPNMAKMMRPRLISREQAKRIADVGGIIGVWTHLTDTPLEYAQNIRALVDIIGVDHVCIGTDTKLTPAYRSPIAGGGPRPDGPPPNNGQNNSGGGQRRERVGERTNAAWADQTTGFYYAVVDALLKTGFSENEIGNIGGGNFCRVFDAATSGH